MSTLCTVAGVEFIVRNNMAAALLAGDVQDVLLRLLTWSQTMGIELHKLEVVRPTLNDVFLGATGCDE
jgi:hypothetical protein